MNKTELVEVVSKATNLKKVEAEAVVDAVFDAIVGSLKNKEEVRLLGFGSFSTVTTKATVARNPRTGEKIDVPSKLKAKFRPGKQILEALEG